MNGLGVRTLEHAFGRPKGLLGRLGGACMARMNAPTERQLVRLAHLRKSDRVLVVGPGPGVGLLEAGRRAGSAVGVEPSAQMRRAAARRCAELLRSGRVRLCGGSAESTGQDEASFHAVLGVNNVQLWSDRAGALAELYRVLHPGGVLLLSTHRRWLPGGEVELADDVRLAGFDEVQVWSWVPPGRGASTAVQLRARRPDKAR